MSTAVVQQKPIDRFFEQLTTAPRRTLLLDYDGTVAPFAVARQSARPYPTIPELLDCITSTCRTRVTLVSGRSAREIPPLLGLNPTLEVWGSHGLERLYPDGRYEVAAIAPRVSDALRVAEAQLEQEGLHELCEVKPGAIAVHWRGLRPQHLEEARAAAYRALGLLVRDSDLLLSEFDGGLEIRSRACSKANAVTTVISETARGTPIAYLGDDVSDEDAFRALHGRGLTVLVRPTYRFTAAQVWLQPPGDLIQFLTDWVRACGGDV